MKKSVAQFIGLRYVGAKRLNFGISLISAISIICIMLSVWVLIVVLSVMNGFTAEIKKRLLNVDSDVTLTSYHDRWQTVIEKAKKHPEVKSGAPYLQQFGLASRHSRSEGVIIRGIDLAYEKDVSKIHQKMKWGSLDNLAKDEWGVVLGYELAQRLFSKERVDRLLAGKPLGLPGEEVSDRITLIIPQAKFTAVGIHPRFKRFKLVGIFRIDFNKYDNNTALISLKNADKFFQKNGRVTGINLKITDNNRARKVLNELIHTRVAYRGKIWVDWHPNLFGAVRQEKRMMFLLLLILILVSAINIISTLIMMVTEKESDIAILRTLGVSPGSVMRIFIIQGTIIGMIGTALGCILGILTANNINNIVNGLEYLMGREIMPASVYYISEIHGVIEWDYVLGVCLSSFLITLLATLYPAARAARVQPAQALRYE